MIVKKPRLAVLIDWFDPAYKAGGPVRSISNFVSNLKQSFEIFVLTSNADLNGPLLLNKTNEWVEHPSGGFQVCYLTHEKQSVKNISSILREISPDFVYLNSMFSIRFSLVPLYLKWAGKISAKYILAPRGMLKDSALSFKPMKKKLFIWLFQKSGWHKLVRFQATDPIEHCDILARFGAVQVIELSNFPGLVASEHLTIEKNSKELQLLFVGRIHPIKNLHLLLQSLQSVRGKIKLSIVGVMESQEYWDQCKELISELPKEIEIKYLGDLPPEALKKVYQEHQVFVLPTQGENFGHAIFDAFAYGRPVLISDQTPWKNLESQKAGWDLGLADLNKYSEKIQEMLEWTDEVYQEWSEGAHRLALDFVNNSDLVKSYHKLFQ